MHVWDLHQLSHMLPSFLSHCIPTRQTAKRDPCPSMFTALRNSPVSTYLRSSALSTFQKSSSSSSRRASVLTMAAPPPAAKMSELDGQAPEATDFANYFCTYGYLYHQVRRSVFSLSSVRFPHVLGIQRG